MEKNKELLKKFRENPIGIRNEGIMKRICLVCGSENVRIRSNEEFYFRVCPECNTEFYRHSCWNCGKNIDERDPQNPRCGECDWFKCTCTACFQNGCRTNPYNRNNKLKDMDEEIDDWESPVKSCPECNGDGYDWEDGGQCHTCAGSGDVTGSP